MDERIEAVVHDIAKVCEEAGLVDHPENLIHIIIAYLRTNKVKTEEDYAINAIVAVLIYEASARIKEDTFKIAVNEIGILCKALMIYDNSHEEKKEIQEDRTDFDSLGKFEDATVT